MKQKLLIAFYIAILFTTTQLQAGYENQLIREDPTGVLTYQNGSINYTSPNIIAGDLRSVTDKAEHIFFFETRLRNLIKPKTCAVLADLGLSCSQFHFDINGPIVIELSGNADGTVDARVGGFDVYYRAKGQKGFWLNGYLTVNTSPIWLNGKYNIVTGDIVNLDIDETFEYNIDLDVDLLGVRFSLDSYVDDVLPFDIETELNAAVDDAQSDLQEDTLFNLNDAIPTGVYIYNGVDYGQLAQNEVVSFLSDESLTLTLDREIVTYNANYSQYGQFFTQYHVNINVSDHLQIDVTNEPVFRQTWVGCSWSQPFCEMEF